MNLLSSLPLMVLTSRISLEEEVAVLLTPVLLRLQRQISMVFIYPYCLDIFGGSSGTTKQEVKPITSQTINTSLFDFTTSTQSGIQVPTNTATTTTTTGGKVDTTQLL